MGYKIERILGRDGRPCGEDQQPPKDVKPMPIPKVRKPPRRYNFENVQTPKEGSSGSAG